MQENRSCAGRSSSTVDGTTVTRTHSECGFTLLELLVALTLATVISLCISTVGSQAQKIYDTTTAKVEVYKKPKKTKKARTRTRKRTKNKKLDTATAVRHAVRTEA